MEKKKISDLVNVYNNKRVPLSSNQRANLEKVYPYYGAQGIVDYVDDFIFNGKYILVAEDGENLRSNKQNICNLVEGKFWVNNHAHILTANDENITDYLYYNFNQIKFEPYITGSAQPKLNKENLLNIETFVHSKKEQQKIAHTLSILDRKIALNQQINAKLEAMAKTLYDYWFVQFDFPNGEGKPYRSSGGEMVWCEELKRDVPKGWENSTIGEIENNIVTGKTPSKENPEYFNGDIPFITIGDIRGNTFIVKTEEKLTALGANTQKNKFLPENAICVTCIATVGLIGFVVKPSQTNQQINSIICRDEYNRYYLYFALLDYFSVAGAKTGNTFANMNKNDFSNIVILKPSNEILKKYFGLVNPIFEKIKANAKQIQKLTQLRDFLLPMLMNGQVGVV